jgi:hypothetical protein
MSCHETISQYCGKCSKTFYSQVKKDGCDKIIGNNIHIYVYTDS